MRRFFLTLAVASGATVLSVGSATAGATQAARPAVSPPSLTSTLPGQGAPRLPSFASERESLPPRADRAALRAAAKKFRGRVAAADVRSIVDGLAPSLTSRDAVVPKSSEVSRVLGPRAAQLRDADGKPGDAAVFGMPIAVAGDADAKWELADLDWQADAGRLTVARSVVPVSLPSVGSGQVRVGDLAARLAPAGAAGSAAHVESESVVYPNVATDADLVVRSLSVGVQVGWVLRSPVAGEEIRVPLDLPPGLSARLDGQGGVRIVDSAGRPAGSWSAATAVDAGGFPVPLETSLDGSTIVIRVDHRAEETEYPVVVDPYFQAGGSASPSDFNAWEFSKTRSSLSFRTNDPGVPGGRTSLFLGSGNVGGWAPTDIATLGRPAPGDQTVGAPEPDGRMVSPEHARWSSGSLGVIKTRNRQQPGMPPARPAVSIGFSPQLSAPTADTTMSFGHQDVYMHFGPWYLDYATLAEVSGTIVPYNPSGVGNSGAWAVVSMLYDGSATPDPMEPIYPPADPNDLSTLSVASYYLTATDDVAPTLDVSSPAGWLDEGDVVRATGTDRGLGISSITASFASSSVPSLPPAADSSPPSCPATGNAFCTFVADVDFSSNDLQEGIHEYTFGTTDGGGRATTKSQTLNVDRSAPTIALSGALYDSRATEIPADIVRPLTVAATDGNATGGPSAQRSGVQRIEVYVDDEIVHEQEQPATGNSAPLSTTWAPDAETFTSGEYEVEVVVTDRVGHETSNSFVVKAPCCSVDLDPGTVAVGDRAHAFGDIDGDGAVDVALVDKATGNVTVARGNGDGTFATQTSWGSFGAAIDTLAAGNVDGNDETAEAEGTDDLVARAGDGTLLLRLSDGSTLVTPDTTGMTDLQATWPADRTLELADVDGDGLADLAGTLSATRQVRVAMSLGAAFESSTSWATVPAGVQAPLGDLNGDGMADLVLYDPLSGDVDFRRSTSIGFEPVETWGSGPTAAEIAVGDLDGNGLADAVFRIGSGTVTGRISSRNEGFASGTVALGSLAASYALHVRDVTGDGRDDVLGARVQSGVLQTRSASSTLRDSEAPDSTADDPDLPDEDGPGTLGARLAAKGAPAPPPKATLMMSDDNALKYNINLGGRTRDDLLQQMKYLGAEKVRTVAWWGQIDRLHPDDESGLVPVEDPDLVPPAVPDPPSQSKSSPPGKPRVVRLERDATDLPASQAADDPAAEWIENPAPGQPGHNGALRAGGEWVVVRDRLYVEKIDSVLSVIGTAGMKAFVTISGGTRDDHGASDSFTTCPSASLDSVARALGVRGCRAGDRTGERPSPERAGHAIASIAEALKAKHGATVEAIGVWNEPNLDSDTFLSRQGTKLTAKGEKVQLNRAALYGEIYAYTYAQMAGREMLSSGTKRVRIGFGDLTSKATKNNGHSTSERSMTPERWVEEAVAAARNASGVDWPGGIVRADIFAVHPYQPTWSSQKAQNDRPWQVNRVYPWGVRGVSASVKRKNNSIEVRSVKAYLSRAAGTTTPKLRRVGAAHATAPFIWATEFGYFTSKRGEIGYSKPSLTHAHSESERKNYLTRTKSRSTKYGALPGMSRQGGVKVIGFWEVLEDAPPAIVHPPSGGLAKSFDDYGFIGSGAVQGGPGSGYGPDGNGLYQAQILRVGGTRPYGPPARLSGTKKKPTPAHSTLRWPQTRSVACAIRAWADPGTPPIPGATSSLMC